MARKVADLAQVAEKLHSKRGITLLEKLEVYQELNRNWRRYLTPYEHMAVSYIIDRSVGFGKHYFSAGTPNILNGNEEYAGIGLTKRTYFKAMNSLEEKGFISRVTHKMGVTIYVHINWHPPEATLSEGQGRNIAYSG